MSNRMWSRRQSTSNIRYPLDPNPAGSLRGDSDLDSMATEGGCRLVAMTLHVGPDNRWMTSSLNGANPASLVRQGYVHWLARAGKA